jgi:protein-tyrosine phosphatase
VRTIESGVSYPLYVHCLSGRDRTGVVIAAMLTIVGFSKEQVLEEYFLSEGMEDRDQIYIAMAGFSQLENYFSGIDLTKVRLEISGVKKHA